MQFYVLYANDVLAGYSGLNTPVINDFELDYFDLLPEFTGRKLGPWFLDWALQRAWYFNRARLWVNTCTLDQPAALTTNLQAGFTAFCEKTAIIRDPRQQPVWKSGHHT